jgi:hypothetical protein
MRHGALVAAKAEVDNLINAFVASAETLRRNVHDVLERHHTDTWETAIQEVRASLPLPASFPAPISEVEEEREKEDCDEDGVREHDDDIMIEDEDDDDYNSVNGSVQESSSSSSSELSMSSSSSSPPSVVEKQDADKDADVPDKPWPFFERKGTGRRERPRPALDDDDAEENDDDDDEEDEEEERVSGYELDSLRTFLGLARRTDIGAAVRRNRWFRQRYGDTLAAVRDQLGNQAHASSREARALFDDLATHVTTSRDRSFAIVEQVTDGNRLCSLCGLHNYRGSAMPYVVRFDNRVEPVARSCVGIARAVVAFWDFVYNLVQSDDNADDNVEASYRQLDELIEAVKQAHANKSDAEEEAAAEEEQEVSRKRQRRRR